MVAIIVGVSVREHMQTMENLMCLIGVFFLQGASSRGIFKSRTFETGPMFFDSIAHARNPGIASDFGQIWF